MELTIGKAIHNENSKIFLVESAFNDELMWSTIGNRLSFFRSE
jgi:hypothetical protein